MLFRQPGPKSRAAGSDRPSIRSPHSTLGSDSVRSPEAEFRCVTLSLENYLQPKGWPESSVRYRVLGPRASERHASNADSALSGTAPAPQDRTGSWKQTLPTVQAGHLTRPSADGLGGRQVHPPEPECHTAIEVQYNALRGRGVVFPAPAAGVPFETQMAVAELDACQLTENTMRDNALAHSRTSSLASAIGARVKHERQSRGWTLDQLAEAAGVSRRMLINIEHGTANPSVATLLRISDGLGVGLPALVERPQARRVKVTRHGDGATLWSSESGGHGILVAGTEPPDVLELWDWTLAPGDRYTSEPHAGGTRELLQIQQGAVAIEVADQSVTLDTGDAISFPGDVAHSYANPGTQPARFSLAVFEPGVGPGKPDWR